MEKVKIHSGDTFISRKGSLMLQGCAAFLMVWHHLFGFPDRIDVPYQLVLDPLFHIETLAAYFGRICIAIFAFCSGYGMGKKSEASGNIGTKLLFDNSRSAISHLWKFYTRYWIVFIAFVPIGFALSVYPIQAGTIVKSLLGMNCTYNAEWWYVGYYVIFLLLFPFLSVLTKWLEQKSPLLMHIWILLCIVAVSFAHKDGSFYSFFSVFVCFLEGMYFSRIPWFERIQVCLKPSWMRLAVGATLMACVFLLRTLRVADYLLVPFFIFGFILFMGNNFLAKSIGAVLLRIGKYSAYIWLIHTFFAYYYFQAFTFAPKYSWLIAIWCILLCVVCGAILERIRAFILSVLQKARTNKSV